MSKEPAFDCDTISERKALFQSFGGLPETAVHNAEWLYMLEEDTRQSLAIEGYFATEDELEAVVQGRKSRLEITNYFRTAETLYDQALQYYRDETIRLDLSLVRHIHSELFRELNVPRGEFRTGAIQIRGAALRPPEFDVESYVRVSLVVMAAMAEELPLLAALARTHVLFESIHPFADGNGRAGRILLNYLSISQGFPPIVIKGTSADERKRYYDALEAADTGFHRGFPEPASAALRIRLEEGNFAPMEELLCEGLLPRLNRMIALALERQEPLADLGHVAAQLGVPEDTLRQRIHRGKHIAIKRGKKLYTHPRLALPFP